MLIAQRNLTTGQGHIGLPGEGAIFYGADVAGGAGRARRAALVDV